MSSDLTVELDRLLMAYDQKVQDVTDQVFQDVAKQTVEKLKNTSPRKTGKYASGWKVKKQGQSELVVYNTRYQLTHLLENSHVIRNKKGTYGRTEAHPHIAPAEEWANNEVQNEIERRLEQ